MIFRWSTPIVKCLAICAASWLKRESGRSSGTPSVVSPICTFGYWIAPNTPSARQTSSTALAGPRRVSTAIRRNTTSPRRSRSA